MLVLTFAFKLLNVGTLCLEDFLHSAPEAAAGPLHHLPVKEAALLLDGSDERGLSGVRVTVGPCLQYAPK